MPYKDAKKNLFFFASKIEKQKKLPPATTVQFNLV